MRKSLLFVAFGTAIGTSAQVAVPYSTGFEGQTGNLAPLFPDGWTWEDLNTVALGNQGWQIIKNTDSQQNAHTDSTAAHMFSHGSETNNDWLYTPGMQLQGGITYTISFWYSVASLFPSTERLALHAGPAPTALAMTETLWSEINIENQVYEQAVAEYTPENDEVTYFAFHYFSEEFQFILLLDDVSITFDGASVSESKVDIAHLWVQDDGLIVELPGNSGTAALSILDAAGRTIRTKGLAGVRSFLGIGDLPDGSYIARLTMANGRTLSRRFALIR